MRFFIDGCQAVRGKPLSEAATTARRMVIQHTIDQQLTQHDDLLQYLHRLALRWIDGVADVPGHVTGRRQRFAGFDQQRFVVHRWIDQINPAGLARWLGCLLRPRIEVMIDRPLGCRFYVFGFQCGVVGD